MKRVPGGFSSEVAQCFFCAAAARLAIRDADKGAQSTSFSRQGLIHRGTYCPPLLESSSSSPLCLHNPLLFRCSPQPCTANWEIPSSRRRPPSPPSNRQPWIPALVRAPLSHNTGKYNHKVNVEEAKSSVSSSSNSNLFQVPATRCSRRSSSAACRTTRATRPSTSTSSSSARSRKPSS